MLGTLSTIPAMQRAIREGFVFQNYARGLKTATNESMLAVWRLLPSSSCISLLCRPNTTICELSTKMYSRVLSGTQSQTLALQLSPLIDFESVHLVWYCSDQMMSSWSHHVGECQILNFHVLSRELAIVAFCHHSINSVAMIQYTM